MSVRTVGRTTRRQTAQMFYFPPRRCATAAWEPTFEMVMTMTMRKTFLSVAAFGLMGLAACSTEPVAPNGLLAGDAIDLLPDYAFSSAAVVDGAGIGGARLPEALQLTAEQKDLLMQFQGRDGTRDSANTRHEPGDPTHPGVTREHLPH